MAIFEKCLSDLYNETKEFMLNHQGGKNMPEDR